MSNEILSEIVEVKQLGVPGPSMMLVVIVAQQNMTPTLLLNEFWSKLVSYETPSETFPNHTLQTIVFKPLESILQFQYLQS